MRSVFLPQLLGVLLLCSETLAQQPIPPSFWGIHVNQSTHFPVQVPFGQFRGWDMRGGQWPDIETCSASSGSPGDACFTWRALDTELADVKQAGVNDILYTLSRTPAWGSPNTSDSNCNYFSLGTQFHGACYPPTDLNDDGSGTNLIWKRWVTAIATRVNDPTYKTTHAHIHSWEIWNEIDRSTTMHPGYVGSASFQGSYNQLVRMAEDARCIIIGQGTIHNTPTAGSSTTCSATAIDSSAKIVMPSSGPTTGRGVSAMQNFLYCNNSPSSTCTNGSAGAAAIDVIPIHLYASVTIPETLMTVNLPAYKAALQPAELAKPIWNGEGSFGTLPNTVNIWNGPHARAGLIARFFAMYYSAGIAENYWYAYDVPTGQLFNGSLITPEATAWTQTYDWLVGATPVSSPFCSASGSIYTCDMSRANGSKARLVWDSSLGQNCAATPVPIVCGATPYNVPAQFGANWIDLAGTVHAATSTVNIGANPILLQGPTGSPAAPTGLTSTVN